MRCWNPPPFNSEPFDPPPRPLEPPRGTRLQLSLEYLLPTSWSLRTPALGRRPVWTEDVVDGSPQRLLDGGDLPVSVRPVAARAWISYDA